MSQVDVWELALSFMDSQALLAADELGVFDVLERGPVTLEQLAQATGLSQDSALRLLTLLLSIGLVRRSGDGCFSNSPGAAAALVRGRPGYVGELFRHVREVLYPAWQYCAHALREGRAQWHRAFPGEPPLNRMYQDPGALRAFMMGMHGITYAASTRFAHEAEELRQLRSIVDVGGATGAFVIALAERFPELRAIVFDLPELAALAQEQIEAAGLGERVCFRAGNFWEDDLPRGADAYALGFILHDWDDGGGALLLRKVSSAAGDGAMIIVGEFLLSDDYSGPRFVARQNLNMLVTARGRERSAAEYAAWLREFELQLSAVYPSSNGKYFLVARKGSPPPEQDPSRATRPAR